jgi:hypothetical protein
VVTRHRGDDREVDEPDVEWDDTTRLLALLMRIAATLDELRDHFLEDENGEEEPDA